MSRRGMPEWMRGAVSRRELGDLLRAVAVGRDVNGDHDGAKRARAGARAIERRDGPGARKHRRTRS